MTPGELAAWIDAQGRRRDDPVTSYGLRHLEWHASGERSGTVTDFDPADGAQSIAQAALDAARQDASATGGPQRYALVAVGSGGPVARKVWRVAGERMSDEGAMSEPPTLVGLLAQLMRHLEAKERTHHQGLGTVLSAYQSLLERAHGRIDGLERLELERAELAERLRSQAHDREIQAAEAASQHELRSRMLARIEPVIPMLTSKLFKLPLAPGDQASSALDQLLSTITPDQVGELERVLTDGQRAALAALYAESHARWAKQEDARSKPAEGAPRG